VKRCSWWVEGSSALDGAETVELSIRELFVCPQSTPIDPNRPNRRNVAIPPAPLQSNVNTVGPGYQLQFTPYGWYSNGLLEPFVNSTYAGSSGTWASSNPTVMYVNQTGVAWALSPGKANITYTSPTGVNFNLWTMTVTAWY